MLGSLCRMAPVRLHGSSRFAVLTVYSGSHPRSAALLLRISRMRCPIPVCGRNANTVV
jgi:hypothetical protein